MKTLFKGDLGYDVDTAKAKCAEGCNANDDCKFADLYWFSRRQTCYLYSEVCESFELTDHRDYRHYIKA